MKFPPGSLQGDLRESKMIWNPKGFLSSQSLPDFKIHSFHSFAMKCLDAKGTPLRR
ncbi:MAG: hypothetical protein KAJ56_01030 [Candidatus Aenigmarchaeota archaeon]|nr:hypothetical protein [Candidatus Aenigmarchaeota archaeon]